MQPTLGTRADNLETQVVDELESELRNEQGKSKPGGGNEDLDKLWG